MSNTLPAVDALNQISGIIKQRLQGGDTTAEDFSRLSLAVRDELVERVETYVHATYRSTVERLKAANDTKTLLAFTDLSTGYQSCMRAWLQAHEIKVNTIKVPEYAPKEPTTASANATGGAIAAAATAATSIAYVKSLSIFANPLVSAIIWVVSLVIAYRVSVTMKKSRRDDYERLLAAKKAEIEQGVMQAAKVWLASAENESNALLTKLLPQK